MKSLRVFMSFGLVGVLYYGRYQHDIELLPRPQMASFSFNSAQQQKQLFSLALRKCPSPLSISNFHFLSHFLTSSPPKHTQIFVVKPRVRNIHTKSSTIETGHESSTITGTTRKKNACGLSSLRTRDKSVDFVVVENTENRLAKDKNTRKNFAFRKRREVGSGNYSLKSKDQEKRVNSSKTMSCKVENEKLGKKTSESRHHEVREKNDEKGSKKSKNDTTEVQLRVELDMCSKRGDVMGAIQLYDKAQREGIKLEQYHYNVILYLCSSAAIGVVKPAKSGSGSRTLDTLGMYKEVSTMNSVHFGESSDGDNGSCSCNKMVDKLVSDSSTRFEYIDSNFNESESLDQLSSKYTKPNLQLLEREGIPKRIQNDQSNEKDECIENQDDQEIRLTEDVKKYALQRGFEIYEKMCLDEVPMNEASLTALGRMAMSMGNGDMAFDLVKKMKRLGINPRLRSYGPPLSVFCNSGDIDKAFAVEKHMLEHGVYPEEPELEALLRVSVVAGRADKVYYLLHKLRTRVRKVSPSTADIIVRWFNSNEAARLGKRKWDERLIKKTMESKGGGWHGLGWLGKGRWFVSSTTIEADASCKCCGEKLAMIDLDPIETENFADSVASIAIKRDKNSNFQKFQKWLDYYGPFEAVVDAANVGLYNQRNFKPSRVNAVVNGIRQKFPSKKWPLIVLHNKRVTGHKMDQPVNRALIEKWKNADALYETPTGSNDDWYWLYAAIKFKCLIVTNDEMRDHTFQLLGNDFFPRWKERHQVRFSFSDAGPEFYMPPPCSVVIQESEKGSWHIPIASEHDYDEERTWLCITCSNSHVSKKNSASTTKDLLTLEHNTEKERSTTTIEGKEKSHSSNDSTSAKKEKPAQKICKNLRNILSASVLSNNQSLLSKIESAEKLGDRVIDFEI